VTAAERTAPSGTIFVNAQLTAGTLSSLRVVGTRIAAIGAAPGPTDLIVDLRGDRLLPGLINAHEHLQLNNLPQLESRAHYRHVSDWIRDVDARRRSDPAFGQAAAAAREGRLLIGGLKNLLCGVTTVAHHDPLYASLDSPSYPVSVLARYGWSHSLYLDGEEKVRDSYRSTPTEWPWIIHAAEGVDERAATEFDHLDRLECIGSNTLLVHGIALDKARRARLAATGGGLIWCPTSNLRLFGKTAAVDDLMALGRVALGTDSRLSGDQDLLQELRVAARIGGFTDSVLESLVTRDSARLLRLTDRGALAIDARADLLILPADARLSTTSRAAVRLVLIAGRVKYGDLDYAESCAPGADWAPIEVDGRSKIIDAGIAARLSAANISEDGVSLAKTTWRAA
jgi:cytosine/adenosine deaminase-related metal-dependent hydrolase